MEIYDNNNKSLENRISTGVQKTNPSQETANLVPVENPTHLPDPNPPETASLQFGKYKVNLSEVRKYQVPSRVLKSELTDTGTIKTYINLSSRSDLKDNNTQIREYRLNEFRKSFEGLKSDYPLDSEPKKHEFEMSITQNINGQDYPVTVEQNEQGNYYAKVKKGAQIGFSFKSLSGINDDSSLDLMPDEEGNIHIIENTPTVTVHVDEVPTVIYNGIDNKNSEAYLALEEPEEEIRGIHFIKRNHGQSRSDVYTAPLIVKKES